jgi:hypothetical protein
MELTRMRRGQSPTRPPVTQPPLADPPTGITDAEIDAATALGQAAPLSRDVTFITRYQGTWWLSTQAGWLPIPPATGTILDQHADRVRHRRARTTTTRATIRAVIALARQATSPPDQVPR